MVQGCDATEADQGAVAGAKISTIRFLFLH